MEHVTDSREGLALLAGEVVVAALALVLVAASPTVDPVTLVDQELPPTALGAGFLVVGAALGALRTADNVDARAAVGELGVGVAIAIAIAANTRPTVVAVAVAVAAASVILRVDSDRIHTVLDH